MDSSKEIDQFAISVKLRSHQSLKLLKENISQHAPTAVLNKGPRVNVICLPTFIRHTAEELNDLDRLRKRCKDKGEKLLILNRSGGGQKPKLPLHPELHCKEVVFSQYPMTTDEVSKLLVTLATLSRVKQ
jgi:hypothetical protein